MPPLDPIKLLSLAIVFRPNDGKNGFSDNRYRDDPLDAIEWVLMG